MLTQEQLQQRLNFITGSDASIICGLNPYANIVQLFLQKTRQVCADDISDRSYVKAGNYLEPAIAKWFEDETQFKTVKVDEMIIHPQHKWMSGNIDRAIVGRPKEILEIKTASNFDEWGQNGDDKTIPEHYMLQCAHYCAVTDADICWVAVLFRGVDFRIYKYERNFKLEQKLIEKEKNFWENNVLKEICPNPTTVEEIKAMRFEIIEGNVVATREVEEAVFKYKEINSQIKFLEEELKTQKDIICVHMMDRDTLLDGFGKPLATWKKSKSLNRFDSNKFKNDNPDLYSLYTYQAEPTRPLLIKG